jgi:hypothetical protein
MVGRASASPSAVSWPGSSNGEIQLVSVPGEGSTFTLFLPGGFVPAPVRRPVPFEVLPTPARRDAVAPAISEAPPVEEEEVGDDRACLQPGDRILLIVENDLTFARTILEVAREHGYKGLITSFGAAALKLTRRRATFPSTSSRRTRSAIAASGPARSAWPPSRSRPAKSWIA